jgi:hypothetical protein
MSAITTSEPAPQDPNGEECIARWPRPITLGSTSPTGDQEQKSDAYMNANFVIRWLDKVPDTPTSDDQGVEPSDSKTLTCTGYEVPGNPLVKGGKKLEMVLKCVEMGKWLDKLFLGCGWLTKMYHGHHTALGLSNSTGAYVHSVYIPEITSLLPGYDPEGDRFLIVLADDSPWVKKISGIPELCDEIGVPYVFVPSGFQLGGSSKHGPESKTKRITSACYSILRFIPPHDTDEACYNQAFGAAWDVVRMMRAAHENPAEKGLWEF